MRGCVVIRFVDGRIQYVVRVRFIEPDINGLDKSSPYVTTQFVSEGVYRAQTCVKTETFSLFSVPARGTPPHIRGSVITGTWYCGFTRDIVCEKFIGQHTIRKQFIW